MIVGDGRAFLVANAEGDDEVIDDADPNFSDSASAADKDATASSSATTALKLSSGGMEFTGSANVSASDDGGGGDASAYVVREFTVTQDLFFHLDATLGGNVFGETTVGHVSLGLASSQNPGYNLTEADSDSFGGSCRRAPTRSKPRSAARPATRAEPAQATGPSSWRSAT